MDEHRNTRKSRSAQASLEAASTQEISTSNSLADLAARINEEHQAVVAAARTTLQHAFNAGEFLLAAKAQVPHGYWGDWLRENCEVSERSAQKYMQLARHRIGSEANPPLTADLTIDEALCSLAKPKPPVEIEADYYAVPSADYLPTEAGTVRIGMVDAIAHFEILAVRADPRHPGFFQIAQMESYGSLDDGGGGSWCEPNGGRPVRADGVREWLARNDALPGPLRPDRVARPSARPLAVPGTDAALAVVEESRRRGGAAMSASRTVTHIADRGERRSARGPPNETPGLSAGGPGAFIFVFGQTNTATAAAVDMPELPQLGKWRSGNVHRYER